MLKMKQIEQLGILPIIVDKYVDIQEVLSSLYCSAITKNELCRVHLDTAKQYWDILRSGPAISTSEIKRL